jgi:hypothetical protein
MKRFPEAAVLIVGLGLIVAGVVLMFVHQHDEFDFQIALLKEFHDTYHWRSFGGAYSGVSSIVVGALMMVASAIVDLLARRAETQPHQSPPAGKPDVSLQLRGGEWRNPFRLIRPRMLIVRRPRAGK